MVTPDQLAARQAVPAFSADPPPQPSAVSVAGPLRPAVEAAWQPAAPTPYVPPPSAAPAAAPAGLPAPPSASAWAPAPPPQVLPPPPQAAPAGGMAKTFVIDADDPAAAEQLRRAQMAAGGAWTSQPAVPPHAAFVPSAAAGPGVVAPTTAELEAEMKGGSKTLLVVILVVVLVAALLGILGLVFCFVGSRGADAASVELPAALCAAAAGPCLAPRDARAGASTDQLRGAATWRGETCATRAAGGRGCGGRRVAPATRS
jgi:hypothetical protein